MTRLPVLLILLILSLVVAIASVLQLNVFASLLPTYLFGIELSPWERDIDTIHVRIFGPAAVWLMLLIAAVLLHGRRGLWLLVGAPFALLLPVVWTNFYLACGLRWLGPVECP
jgi:hypothetical protein